MTIRALNSVQGLKKLKMQNEFLKFFYKNVWSKNIIGFFIKELGKTSYF